MNQTGCRLTPGFGSLQGICETFHNVPGTLDASSPRLFERTPILAETISEPNVQFHRSTLRKLESEFRKRNDAATQTTLNGKQALFLAVALFVHG